MLFPWCPNLPSPRLPQPVFPTPFRPMLLSFHSSFLMLFFSLSLCTKPGLSLPLPYLPIVSSLALSVNFSLRILLSTLCMLFLPVSLPLSISSCYVSVLSSPLTQSYVTIFLPLSPVLLQSLKLSFSSLQHDDKL